MLFEDKCLVYLFGMERNWLKIEINIFNIELFSMLLMLFCSIYWLIFEFFKKNNILKNLEIILK